MGTKMPEFESPIHWAVLICIWVLFLIWQKAIYKTSHPFQCFQLSNPAAQLQPQNPARCPHLVQCKAPWQLTNSPRAVLSSPKPDRLRLPFLSHKVVGTEIRGPVIHCSVTSPSLLLLYLCLCHSWPSKPRSFYLPFDSSALISSNNTDVIINAFHPLSQMEIVAI